MKRSLVFLVSILSISSAFSQSKLDLGIENLEKNYTQEKVYLLLDKDNYVVGDNLFFKSFVFDGYLKSNISTNLYIELYDHEKNLVDKKTVLLTNGEGEGSFSLNEFLNEDIYYIRAYTEWMANFSEDFNFIKQIPIYNPNSTKKLVLDNNNKWTAKAFPEGGELISDIETKVSVRMDYKGNPQKNWSGYLIDETAPNQKLVSFKNLDQNIALFTFTPKFGKNYKVIIEGEAGSKETIKLAPIKEKGVNLKIVNTDSKIDIAITSKNLEDGLKNHTIIGTVSNRLAYKAAIKTDIKEATTKIPISSEQNNVVMLISILDPQDKVVAQRLVFVKPNKLVIEEPSLNFSLDNAPRAFNSIDINPDDDYKNYTVLVKDPDDNNNSNYNNLLSTLWLTGDFTSSIYSPAQYFTKNNNVEALDALMISEKWERFNLNNVIAGEKPIINYAPEKLLSYKGKVLVNGRPYDNKPINLVFSNKDDKSEKSLSTTQTDKNGMVYLNNVNISQPLKVNYFINTDKKNNSTTDNIYLSFTPNFENIPLKKDLPYSNYKLVEGNTDNYNSPSVAKAIQNYKNTKAIDKDETLIEEVQIKVKKQDLSAKLDKTLSSSMFNSINATVIDLINENQDAQFSPDILQWLQGRVPGVTFQRDSYGALSPYIRNSPAKLYLDEIPADASMITSTPSSSIAMVKVFKSGGLINNAIAIYTKKGDLLLNDNSKKENTNFTIINGYDQTIEFEQPDFSKESYKKINKDTRALLYWNPTLTEEPGLAPRIKFFNNDEVKNRQIIIISFDKDDNLLYYNEIK